MQAFDGAENELVCSHELRRRISRAIAGLALRYSDENCAIISLGDRSAEIIALVAEQGQRVSPRFMDRYFIEVDADDRVRQGLLTSLFSVLAPQYRDIVDVHRNLENIDNLLTIIRSNVDWLDDGLVADLGCGIGLSVEAAARHAMNVVGIDPCRNMRQFAELNGLSTLAPGDVARLPANSLQGVFASYVFHLIPETGLLRLTWQRTIDGGVLAANFHKEQGVIEFQNVMRELRGQPICLPPQFDSTRHGRYLAFRKPLDDVVYKS